jgi:hypothetical protein
MDSLRRPYTSLLERSLIPQLASKLLTDKQKPTKHNPIIHRYIDCWFLLSLDMNGPVDQEDQHTSAFPNVGGFRPLGPTLKRY